MRTRKRWLAQVVLGCAVVMLVVGCSSGRVEMTEADNGSRQKIAVGQELRVTLESNPSTGYHWDIDGALPAQLEQIGSSEYTQGGGPGMTGAPGTEAWTFKGRTTGEAQLKMKYWRTFEPTATPAETFAVDVTVE